MKSIKVKAYVGQDEVLSLRLSITNQAIEAMSLSPKEVIRNRSADLKRFWRIMVTRFLVTAQRFCKKIAHPTKC